MDEKFLIKFAQTNRGHNGFRFPELESLASLFKVKLNYLDYDESYPYLVLTADDRDKLFKVVGRAVGVMHLLQLIEYDDNKERYLEKLRESKMIKQHSEWCEESFRIEVDVFNRKISIKDKVDRIEELNFLPFEGEINLKNPTNVFHLIECCEEGSSSGPVKFYFSKHLIDGNRKLISELGLSKRKFISNTSMDAELSLIMANLARVKANDLCCDLFAGSGSLMVAIAKFGGYCFGIDIDYSLLQGISKSSKAGQKLRETDESVRANFEQYNIGDKYLDMIIGDSSLPLWKDSIKFDSIITDPPYSIRESALKIGSKREDAKIPEEYLDHHTPQKIQYSMYELIKDLLNFASVHLNMNGRLVFWYPLNKSFYSEEDLPMHPNFKIISHDKQVLAGKYLRILITLEKIHDDQVTLSANSLMKENIPQSAAQFKKMYHEKRMRKYD